MKAAFKRTKSFSESTYTNWGSRKEITHGYLSQAPSGAADNELCSHEKVVACRSAASCPHNGNNIREAFNKGSVYVHTLWRIFSRRQDSIENTVHMAFSV